MKFLVFFPLLFVHFKKRTVLTKAIGLSTAVYIWKRWNKCEYGMKYAHKMNRYSAHECCGFILWMRIFPLFTFILSI